MNGHPQFEEDFELYALGVLEGAEKAGLEGHLAGCADCQARLEGARARMALLALAAPAAAPPAGARERMLERFRAERPGPARPAQVRAMPPPLRRSPWAPLWAAAAMILLAAAAWFAIEDRRLSSEMAQLEATHRQLEDSSRQLQAETAKAQAALDVLTAPETVQVELAALAARPVPHGKAFYNASQGLLFYAANLPALPAGRTYELWLIPSTGAPVGAGVFSSDARGNGQVILPPLPHGVAAKAFAVTIEPAGGTSAPTGPKVLIGLVS